MAMGCYNITMVMHLTWWTQWKIIAAMATRQLTANVIMNIISGFIQLEKRNRQLFFHSFPLLVFITIWSLVISSCIHFCFSFSSVCGGGQEKRRHGRCMPDSLLDNFVLLLSLGHADITCSPAVHAHYPPAPMSLCLDSNHPSPHLP